MISEPDVALTDGLVALQAIVLMIVLPRGDPRARRAWRAFFGSIAVAAMLGGIAHGFLSGTQGLTAVVVWRATLLAIGVTAAAGLVAAALATSDGRRGLFAAAVLGWLAYALVVIFVTDAFAVAIVAYTPVTLALLAAFVARFARTGLRAPLVGAVGLLVLLAGSWVQWRRIALHPVYFTHNAVYHVIEMVALVLIHRGARDLVTPRR